MRRRLITKVAVWCAISVFAAGATGCSSASNEPSAAGAHSTCTQAQFSPQQFTGDWTEPGDTTITTLGADGTLKSLGGTENQSGTWNYAPWGSTPAKHAMPAGEADHCVLWLHWTDPQPATDMIYVPLNVTTTSLQLSYVGRGNTLSWTRPNAAD